MTRPPQVGLLIAWAAAGLLGAFGLAALLTVGLPFVVAALLVVVAIGWRRGIVWPEPVGALLGVSAILALLAYLNRGGPGSVCRAGSCVDEWSPWPFAALAVLVAAGAVGLAAWAWPRAARRGR